MRPWIAASLAAMACGEPASPAPDCAHTVRAALPALWAGWDVPQTPDAVWDALATGLAGDLLTDRYVATWTRRARMAAEGTDVRPLSADIEAVEVVAGAGCAADVRYALHVVIAHQGHRHPRVLRQEARVTLDGGRLVAAWPRALRVVEGRGGDPFLDDADAAGFLPGDVLLEAGLLDTGDGP